MNVGTGFSVVVASWSGEAALRRSLESLLPQINDSQVIVAFRGESPPVLAKERRFCNVHFVTAPRDANVFQLRSLGLREARGGLVALIEDHSVVSREWLQALNRAHAAGSLICGGPIENDPESSGYDWALYLAEYGRFMPPLDEGETRIISGANISYDRETLWSCYTTWESFFYETDVNAALMDAGKQARMVPEALVTSRLRMRFLEATKHLFEGGVHFGNFRATQSTLFARILWIIASPAIPFLTLFRIVRVTIERQPWRFVKLIQASLYLIVLVCAWSLGETIGYLKQREGP